MGDVRRSSRSQWRRLRSLPMKSAEFRRGVFRPDAKGGREIEFCASFRYGKSRASGPASFVRLGNEGQMDPRMLGEATTKKAPRTIKPIGRAADVRVYYDACSTDGRMAALSLFAKPEGVRRWRCLQNQWVYNVVCKL